MAENGAILATLTGITGEVLAINGCWKSAIAAFVIAAVALFAGFNIPDKSGIDE